MEVWCGMKVTDLSILFIIIILPFVQILRIQTDNLQSTAYRSMVMDRYLDAAVEDASEAMVVRGAGRKAAISRDKALSAFCNTLFANFNVLGNKVGQENLMLYVPVLVLLDYDGFWVCSTEEYINSAGNIEEKMVWKPKKPYSHESNGYTYIFTLDSHVKVLDNATNTFYEGTRQDLTEFLSEDLIQQEELFEAVRKRTVMEAIKKDVNQAINAHNTYAIRYGITYNFSPPSISDGDWYRNIEDIGFLAFFQGIPIGLGGERYNSFALGASRIVRKENYYIQQDANGLFYYHRDDCSSLTSRDEAFDSREECALKGAFPCHRCNP